MVKTYFSEYSLSKPALTTQFIFDKIDTKGTVFSTYKYTNNLINFNITTNVELEVNKVLSLHLDDERRFPVRFSYKIIYKKGIVLVELL